MPDAIVEIVGQTLVDVAKHVIAKYVLYPIGWLTLKTGDGVTGDGVTGDGVTPAMGSGLAFKHFCHHTPAMGSRRWGQVLHSNISATTEIREIRAWPLYSRKKLPEREVSE